MISEYCVYVLLSIHPEAIRFSDTENVMACFGEIISYHDLIFFLNGKFHYHIHISSLVLHWQQVLLCRLQFTKRAKLGSKAFAVLKKGKPMPDALLIDIILEKIRFLFITS